MSRNPFLTFMPDTQPPITNNLAADWRTIFETLFPGGQYTTERQENKIVTIVNENNVLSFPNYKLGSNFKAGEPIVMVFNVAGLDPKNVSITSVPSKNIFQVKYTRRKPNRDFDGKEELSLLYSGGLDSKIYDLYRIESEINNGILEVTLPITKVQYEETLTFNPICPKE
jgi:HSP20 family molecular chaperone IbpA